MDRRDFLAGAAAALTAWAVKDVAFPTEASAQAAPAQKLVTQSGRATCSGSAPRPRPECRPVWHGRRGRRSYAWPGGYAAVDLTVRDDGHVLPAQVATNLPLMLNGIRSTGAICDHIGVNFAPPSDPANTAWIASQFVHEILSVAGANGIKKYRYNNRRRCQFPGQHVRPADDGAARRRPDKPSPPGGDQCAVRRSARRGPYAWGQYRHVRWSPMPIRCRASTPN